MKLQQIIIPFILSLIAAIGNALVSIGQKKATTFSNPFFFGAFSLLLSAIVLFIIAFLFDKKGFIMYATQNLKWIVTSALGFILLNISLFILYRSFGTNYYTLYAILAILTTSIFTSIYFFNEKMNFNYYISLCFAALTIIFFLKGKINIK